MTFRMYIKNTIAITCLIFVSSTTRCIDIRSWAPNGRGNGRGNYHKLHMDVTLDVANRWALDRTVITRLHSLGKVILNRYDLLYLNTINTAEYTHHFATCLFNLPRAMQQRNTTAVHSSCPHLSKIPRTWEESHPSQIRDNFSSLYDRAMTATRASQLKRSTLNNKMEKRLFPT